MSKHTPFILYLEKQNRFRVLVLRDDGRPIAEALTSGESRDTDNGAYIVHCVNTHQALVDALEEITSRFERLEALYFTATNQTPDCENGSVKRAREALKQAKEREA